MNNLEIVLLISLVLICISLMLIVARFLMGPTLEDKIVSLDLLMTTGIAFIAVYSMITNKKTILDVGIIIALLAFLSTVAFAFYLERRSKR